MIPSAGWLVCGLHSIEGRSYFKISWDLRHSLGSSPYGRKICGEHQKPAQASLVAPVADWLPARVAPGF